MLVKTFLSWSVFCIIFEVAKPSLQNIGLKESVPNSVQPKASSS